MKRLYFLFLFSLIASLSVVAQDSEKASVIQVIEDEHNFFCERNYDKWAATYDQTENILWGNGVGFSMRGWEMMSKEFKTYFADNPEPTKPSTIFDHEVTINGDRAWVTSSQRNPNGNVSKRLTSLIKREGQWKIVALLFN